MLFKGGDMSYTIAPSKNGKYIVCQVSGLMTREVSLAFTKELDRLSRELHIKRFLTDVREAKNVLSVLENYDYAYKDMQDMNLQRDVRVAILVAPADESHSFALTVSRNVGYDVRAFHDEKAAIGWLNE